MKLMVVGRSENAEQLVELLRRPNEVRHVTNLEELATGSFDEFDWILLDEGDPCASDSAKRSVQASGSRVPLSRVSVPQPVGETRRGPMPICAVETTSDGMQILRCALRHAARNPDADPALTDALGDRPVVFEYHAPQRRTG